MKVIQIGGWMTDLMGQHDDNGSIVAFGKEREGKFVTDEGLVRFIGRGGDSLLSNVARIFAIMTKEKLMPLIADTKRGTFVNGGTYSSGWVVQETIFYVPTIGRHEMHDTQMILTYHGEVDPYNNLSKYPHILLQDQLKAVKGVRVSENSPYLFASVLGFVHFEEHYHKDNCPWTIRDFFPQIEEGEVNNYNMVLVGLKELNQYTDIVAKLIHQYYFEGKTYQQLRSEREEELRVRTEAEATEGNGEAV